MTTRQAHRLLIWTAPPVGLGAAVLAARTYPGMGWGVALTAVAGAVIGALAALLPQESEHRRDVWRDWLRQGADGASADRYRSAPRRPRPAHDHEPSGRSLISYFTPNDT